MFQEIVINRSLPNLRKLLSHQLTTGHGAAALLRTPDPSRDNATPFLLACLSGNQGICTYLLELGADYNAKSSRCRHVKLSLAPLLAA
jgi:ankyrin repeat protein